MADKRTISTSFWNDSFIEGLQPLTRLVYLYLLTNKATRLCGLYECTTRLISFETGLTTEQVQAAISELMQGGKVVADDGLIFVVNYKKHQNGTRCSTFAIHVKSTAIELEAEQNLAYKAFIEFYADILVNDSQSGKAMGSIPQVYPKTIPSIDQVLTNTMGTLQEEEQEKEIIYTERGRGDTRGETKTLPDSLSAADIPFLHIMPDKVKGWGKEVAELWQRFCLSWNRKHKYEMDDLKADALFRQLLRMTCKQEVIESIEKSILKEYDEFYPVREFRLPDQEAKEPPTSGGKYELYVPKPKPAPLPPEELAKNALEREQAMKEFYIRLENKNPLPLQTNTRPN